MRSSIMVLIQSLLLVLAQSAALSCGATEPQSPDSLLQDLANKDATIQEKAARELLQREDAAPALRKAVNTADKETAKRAQAVLKERQLKNAVKIRAAIQEDSKKGHIDRLVDRFASLEGDDVDDGWQAVLDGGWGVSEKAVSSYMGSPRPDRRKGLAGLRLDKRIACWMTCPDLVDIRKYLEPKDVIAPNKAALVPAGPVLIRGGEVFFARGTMQSLVVATESLTVKGGALWGGAGANIMLVNGPVKLEGDLVNTVLICDGDVEFSSASVAIVVARGNVTCKEISDWTVSFIYAGGTVKIEKEPKGVKWTPLFGQKTSVPSLLSCRSS
jgi:hypothetical protein